MSWQGWLREVKLAVQHSDGDSLRELLKLDSNAAFYAQQIAQRGGGAPAADIRQQLPEPWDVIITAYVQALIHLARGDRLAACKALRDQHARPMVEGLKDHGWATPAVVGMASSLKELSQQADEEIARKGGTPNQLAATGEYLQSVFRNTAASKGADNEMKRRAAVAIACIMMKVFFRLNTINNCKTVIKTVDETLKVFDTAAAAHRVTFRYYTGRLATYDEDFVKANEHLLYAFKNCQTEAKDNKRRVLRYLIPVRMLLGYLPTDTLLSEYGLTEYHDIAVAVRSGDVGLLVRTLETNQMQFVQAGTYLLLEKLQLATYRRLIKKCALVNAEMSPAKAAQLPLALVHKALELQGVDKDNAELQCIVANLIYRKYLKGYIAFKQRVLVLAKSDAFPDLASVQLADPFSA